MKARFLLGPAGSGKTFRCLAEIRAALEADPEGAPLVLLAPKQATFQLERQLLGAEGLAGYTRLQILSFDRLAEFVFAELAEPLPPLLAEEGRVMVLRALLERHREELKIFLSSARMPRFAQKLSQLLRELQSHHLGVDQLEGLSSRVGSADRLDDKLHDLARLLAAYLEWLKARNLADTDTLLDLAAEALETRSRHDGTGSGLAVEGLWLDGFAQMTPQERRLLMALLSRCQRATLAFCLEALPEGNVAWHSLWSLVSRTCGQCYEAVKGIAGAEVEVESIPRLPGQGRLAANPVLSHIERCWADPQPLSIEGDTDEAVAQKVRLALRVVSCANAEGEATWVAREIRRFVRTGGRYRDVAVLVRQLDGYHDALRRVFSRYEIPFFLDRREAVAHHPLADLTRHSLHTMAFRWRHADWFGALKTGLVPATEEEIDRLENEALARGWEGSAWESELKHEGAGWDSGKLEELRQRLVTPFQKLDKGLAGAPTGPQLAGGVRRFWEDLNVAKTLDRWIQSAPLDGPSPVSDSIHATVWDQMQEWLETVELAFPKESMPLLDWLPILDTGLAGLTVGVIPPVLDQVLIGSIDRSRNPDLRQVFLLGVNETIFPAVPTSPNLLSSQDRARLDQEGHGLGPDLYLRLGHERFYGYIACTRARERLAITYAARDAEGRALNPSSFIPHLRRLVPSLEMELFAGPGPWVEAEHAGELIAPLLRHRALRGADCGGEGRDSDALSILEKLPVFAPVLDRLSHLGRADQSVSLDPALAEAVYGETLETSVSQLEQFAACPFRFFVSSGLGAEERVRYELDIREQGSFQHEVLSEFHKNVRSEGNQWRDLSGAEAREKIGQIAEELLPTFQNGMLLASWRNRFLAGSYTESLQRFIEVIIGWFGQYQFDPEVVEIGFGLKDGALPAWVLDLGGGHRLGFRGRIDRVDLLQVPGRDEALCVVIDYKSSVRKVDRVLREAGIQLQLPAYLNVLRMEVNPKPVFGVSTLTPAGVFYVNLRGAYEIGANRVEVLEGRSDADRRAYMHHGLFDFTVLKKLDSRMDATKGDQFPYRLKKNGEPYSSSVAAMEPEEFFSMLDSVEGLMREMGQRIYAGEVAVDPYKKGKETACDKCDYQSVCRIDPWVHRFRSLRDSQTQEEPG